MQFFLENEKDFSDIKYVTTHRTGGMDKNNYMKIAAIGIRVKKWIAYHGFALNVSNDLTKYKKIVPCGIKDKGITSLKNMGIRNYENINEIIEKKFLNTFL